MDSITQIKAGVIASSNKAIKEDRNRHSTAAILYTNLENRTDYKAHSFGLGGGFSKETSQPQQPALQQNGVGKNQPGQAAAVNTIQGLGAQQIKLVADSFNSEEAILLRLLICKRLGYFLLDCLQKS